MIRARADRPDKPPLAILGITRENVKRLKAGKPIQVEGSSLGVACDIVIVFGETELDIVDEMRQAGLPIEPIVQRRGERNG